MTQYLIKLIPPRLKRLLSSFWMTAILIGTAYAFASFADPSPAWAAGGSTSPTTSSGSAAVGVFMPFGSASLPTLIGRIIRYFVGFVGAVALIAFVYAGFLWMTAHGREDQVTKAKNILLWSVLGIAAVLGSYGLVKLLFFLTYRKSTGD